MMVCVHIWFLELYKYRYAFDQRLESSGQRQKQFRSELHESGCILMEITFQNALEYIKN